MHHNVNVLIFFNICPKKAVLKLFKSGHSLAFSCLHLLSPKKNSLKIYYITIFLCHGPLPLPLQTRWTMLVGSIGFEIYLLDFRISQTPWSLWDLFLGVNRSGPRTSSTTNHKFTRPWDDFIVYGVNKPLVQWTPKVTQILKDQNYSPHNHANVVVVSPAS